MFNPRIYENSRPDGIPVLEVAGEGAEQPAQLSFVPLQRTQLQGVVSGPLADLYLTQVFGYDRTTYPDAIEALYRFPLPGDAAVQGVIVRFGEVEIVATLQERTAAEATYGEAKAAGHQAALASREAPDLFTLQITGIQPDQLVTIETHYVQLARADQSGFSATGERIPQWSLRIPLTTAPRYVRADEQAGRWAQAQPLALLRDPRHRFALDLTFHGVSEVTSPTHQLAVTPNLSPHPSTPNAASVHIQLADGEVLPDRDCLLRWSPPQLAADPTIQWITYWDGVAGQAQPGEREDAMLYFLAVVTPPSQRVTEENRREALLLVDHSGSMRGAKWS
ncbi:MAG: hypothetical protein KDE19_13105, partial [Caldilineaceae bacterium]|nr:hypothetical protein [Caldilineaceae bacterium]